MTEDKEKYIVILDSKGYEPIILGYNSLKEARKSYSESERSDDEIILAKIIKKNKTD